jgi:transcriptional regulator with XRE-family HTH domain
LTGHDLRYKIEQAGFSLTEVASLLGISPQNLQNRLKSQDFKIGFIQELAKAINKSVYFLIASEGKNVEVNVEPIVEVIEKKGDLISKKERLSEIGLLNGTQKEHSRRASILLVPVKARAGYLSGYGDPEYIEKLEYYNIPGCRGGNYRMFEVAGHSMHPTLRHGDYAVGQAVTDCCNVKDGTIYIIVSRSEGIIIKRVLNDPEMPGKLVLNSDNQDKKSYPPIILPGASLLECWELYKVITDPPPPEDPVARRLSLLEKEMAEIKRSVKNK